MSDGIVSWFYNQDGNTKGPFKPNEIDALIRAGAVDEHTKMWSERVAEWTPLYRTELRALLGDKAIQPPPLSANPQPPRDAAGADVAKANPPPYEAARSPFAQPQVQRTPPAQPNTVSAARALHDNRSLANVVRGLVWFTGFLALVQAVAIFKTGGGAEGQYRMARQIENEFGPFAAIFVVATSVVFLVWKYRATDNLFRFRGAQTITPAGAVYWYFVPVAWFWKPYEAMRNLVDGFGSDDRTGVQAWWLLFWIAAAIAVFIAIVTPDPVRTVSQARIYAWGCIVMSVVEALWCWVAADLVKSIAAAESKSLNQT